MIVLDAQVQVRLTVVSDGRCSRHAAECLSCRVVLVGPSRRAVVGWAREHAVGCPRLYDRVPA